MQTQKIKILNWEIFVSETPENKSHHSDGLMQPVGLGLKRVLHFTETKTAQKLGFKIFFSFLFPAFLGSQTEANFFQTYHLKLNSIHLVMKQSLESECTNDDLQSGTVPPK